MRLVIGLVLALLACSKATPEEKGRNYAEEKLGFAQGAADTLKEKGAALGQSAGKGLGDLAKGVGSGVKDSVAAKVPTEAQRSAIDAGVTVHHAQEGEAQGDVRLIHSYVEFSKVFRGRLELYAFDASGTELGRGVLKDALNLAAGSKEQLSFRFPATVRFSHVKSYKLHYIPAAELALAQSLSGVRVSQFRQQARVVTVYVQFPEPYKGRLEMRAYAADGSELGRSEKTDLLKQSADSAEHFDFTFDERVPLAEATRFELR